MRRHFCRNSDGKPHFAEVLVDVVVVTTKDNLGLRQDRKYHYAIDSNVYQHHIHSTGCQKCNTLIDDVKEYAKVEPTKPLAALVRRLSKEFLICIR